MQNQQLHRLKSGQLKQLRAGLIAAQTLDSHHVRPKAVRNLLGAAEAAEALATTAAAVRRPAAAKTLIEYCCEPNSRLSHHASQKGVHFNRISLPDYDVSKARDVTRVIELGKAALRRGEELWLWGSLPCSPWCPWHNITVVAHPNFKARLAVDRARSRQMLRGFLRVVRALRGPRTKIAFEWAAR